VVALLTVCAACPLLLLGAEVTTKGWGMVDRQGFRPPWHLPVLFAEGSLVDRGLGYVVEHSHRLAGYAVGSGALLLALGLWLQERRAWLRWLGLAALVAVSLQGIFGIFRVELHARMGANLAFLHGCFAQLVFALLASLAVFTSPSWQRQPTGQFAGAGSLWHWSLFTAGLVYVQLILGGAVRHKDLLLGARAHLLTAFAVTVAVAWLIKLVLDNPQRSRFELWPALLLGGLLVVQLVLGVESWLSKFSAVLPLEYRQLTPLRTSFGLRSLHYFAGTLIFTCTVVVALQAQRRLSWSAAAAPVKRLEGAA
jgi:cytochrome c oxidase assembly protein subunit 15